MLLPAEAFLDHKNWINVVLNGAALNSSLTKKGKIVNMQFCLSSAHNSNV